MKSTARLKCKKCRRWMSSTGRTTDKTPAIRRDAPHASRCTDCPPEHYLCGCPEANA